MSKSESKSANYAAVAQRDKLASALAAETGCGFVEAWERVLDGERATTGRAPLGLRHLRPSPRTKEARDLSFREETGAYNSEPRLEPENGRARTPLSRGEQASDQSAMQIAHPRINAQDGRP